MNVSFDTLEPDAVVCLTLMTGIDFSRADMRSWFCVTARNDAGRIMGVLACEPLNVFDYRFSCAIPDRRCMSPRLLRTIFTTLFKVAGRITAYVDPGNDSAIDQCERLGFRYEGFLRRGLDGHHDALIYGLLPEECIWLIHPKYHAAVKRSGGIRHGVQPKAS